MTLVERLAAELSDALAGEPHRAGERLPSLRRAAASRGVSKNTMSEVYDRLVARGLLEARRGSGYYVAANAPSRPARPAAHLAAAIDTVSLLREQIDGRFEVRPGDGRPPPTWMEGSELGRHFRRSRTRGSRTVDFGYGSVMGHAALRERLRTMLAERFIDVADDGLLLSGGANDAYDLIVRRTLEPGDTVLVDAPGYYPLFAKLQLAKVRAVGVRRNPDGPDLEDLEARLVAVRPKAFFTQSHAHNPTGGTLSPAIAHGVLRACSRHGALVIENDAFADLVPPTLARLASLSALDGVLHVGTFSKTLSASLRCGFVAGTPPLVRELADVKLITGVASSDFVERFVVDLIDEGHYLRHLRRLRARVERANAQAVDALRGIGLAVRPNAVPGFYLWIELPDTVAEEALCRAAAAEGIFLAPGRVFRPERDEAAPAALRVNVAYATDARLLDFLRRHA